MDGSQILGLNLTSRALQAGSKKQYGKKKTVKHLRCDEQSPSEAIVKPPPYQLYWFPARPMSWERPWILALPMFPFSTVSTTSFRVNSNQYLLPRSRKLSRYSTARIGIMRMSNFLRSCRYRFASSFSKVAWRSMCVSSGFSLSSSS